MLNRITLGVLTVIICIMTLTCSTHYFAEEMLLSAKPNVHRKRQNTRYNKLLKPDIDHSTEIWLGEVEKSLNYKIWFCGHYHIDKPVGEE